MAAKNGRGASLAATKPVGGPLGVDTSGWDATNRHPEAPLRHIPKFRNSLCSGPSTRCSKWRFRVPPACVRDFEHDAYISGALVMEAQTRHRKGFWARQQVRHELQAVRKFFT